MQALIFIEAHGKIRAWKRISYSMNLDACLVATSGHICKYPDRLNPLGISLTNGMAIDSGRQLRGDIRQRIESALLKTDQDTPIFIATDNDIEGDVIALDLVNVIIDIDPQLIYRCRRLRPGAITKTAVSAAIQHALVNEDTLDGILDHAIPGRARAMTDRWIGATFSRLARTGCGRVRAAMIGMALCWKGAPEVLQGIPETGELTFQVRSMSGGLPYTARLPIHGKLPKGLIALARKYEGRFVPGVVRPMKSLSAAVAPRFGNVSPFNTGDALAYASRFHGVSASAAMRGLQAAYMNGRISYPRTECRSLCEQSAGHVAQLAKICGVKDVTMDASIRIAPSPGGGDIIHEGLHPIITLTKKESDRLKSLVRKPIGAIDEDNPKELEDFMVALVARRAFEALREVVLEPGLWEPRNDSGMSNDEVEALRDLEWTRPSGSMLPWSRATATGFRAWPMSAILVDGMMIEGVGRPSTYASHVEQAISSGVIQIPEPGRLPEPTAEGRRVLKALPKGARLPSTCRLIEEALQTPSDQEDLGQSLAHRSRARINRWFGQMPEDVRAELVSSIKDGQADLPGAAKQVSSSIIFPDLESELAGFGDEIEVDETYDAEMTL